VTGECRKLRDEELYILFCTQGILRMNKCNRNRYVVHVARMGTSSIRTDGSSWADCRNMTSSTFIAQLRGFYVSPVNP
jgi:hypothetical protein